jgi:predicted RNA polymerase sigma factor
MTQRISRARQTIRESDVPFRMPVREERYQRLRSVLHVLHPIFNESCTASAGEQLQRGDLAAEAIRLARVVYTELPEDAETAGLPALMLLTDARRAGRSGPQNEAIPIDKQDRSLWDRTQIAEGVELTGAALTHGAVGPYQLEAAIAAVHDEAATASNTDWPQILALYSVLKRMVDNTMATLNHAVAVAMVHGPGEGLRPIGEPDATGRLRDHHRLHAVRGHLLEMAEELINPEHLRPAGAADGLGGEESRSGSAGSRKRGCPEYSHVQLPGIPEVLNGPATEASSYTCARQ